MPHGASGVRSRSGPVLAVFDCVNQPLRTISQSEYLPNDMYGSGVSWSAVFAGATVTAALGLVLLALGVGFGLSVTSEWSNRGSTTTTLAVSAIAWMVAMQMVASGVGGYLAGRLRTKWMRVHGDEVHFRDTAHGFLSWSVATIVAATLLATAAAALVTTPGPSGEPSRSGLVGSYYVDAMFRPSRPGTTDVVSDETRAEAGRVLAVVIEQAPGATADRDYLIRLVSSRTGLTPSEAERQVDDVLARGRSDLDAVRKTAARASLWMFLALLVGAFCSSVAATIGGRQRDHIVAVA